MKKLQIEEFGILLVVLFAFFFAWRTVLISFVAVPVSLVVAGGVLALRGTTLNMMLLAGLAVALGVVIDDAIIDVENITRRLRQERQAGAKATATIMLEAAADQSLSTFGAA
jgi:multidrug efflux pump subunit AcrB